MKENKFEDNLKKLETLNNKIKSGEMAIDESVKYFEEGMKLAESLEKEISNIEKKVEILINNPMDSENAEPEFKDFQE
ncbi:MAG: exodeoxyribonuclease VII small subunit [Spirochaetaceae bacterium]|jgi:exodeoxyribonuclease VII small subunit|nr:exodeoxyribonuclease VII small subunit [Spirochaetaceae bacterium]